MQTLRICPHCNRRYSVNEYDEDYVHVCNSGQPVLDQDDVLDVNRIKDPIPNELWGTDAYLEGEKKVQLTVRGNIAVKTKTRQHEEYIDLKDE